jgi:SAM-dependent methyltransferase
MRGDPPLSLAASLRWAVVKRLVFDLQPRTVLEVGCGQGGFAARLAARASYVGVEPDQQSFEVARTRAERRGGRVVHGTTADLPTSATFDLVCAFEVVEHLDDDLAAVTEWTARVADGGALLLSAPAWPNRFGPSDEMVGHRRRYTPEQFRTLLRDSGYSDVQVVLYGWPIAFATERIRNWIAGRRTQVRQLSLSDRTAASGRTLQPSAILGWALRIGITPFAIGQRLRPDAGTGLIALGRR